MKLRTDAASTANTTSKKNREIKYIVIHYTAGVTSKPGSAYNTAKYFGKDTTKASADYIVDDEYVCQFNMDIKNRYTWHCGGSKYKTKGGSLYGVCTNANSIGIEICSSNSTKKVTNANDANWYYTDEVIANTVELVQQLMKDYNIDADHVIRHYDVTGKPCPGIIGWNADTGDGSKWLKFKTDILGQDLFGTHYPDCEHVDEIDKLKEEVAYWKAKYEASQSEINKIKDVISGIKNVIDTLEV